MQFCVDPVDNGALSSCPAGEGHTWGKVSAECVEHNSIYCHCDVTAVFPWIVHALMSEGLTRPHKRYLDRMDEAIATMNAEILARRDQLLEGVYTTPDEILGA